MLTGKYLEKFESRIRRGPDCWEWDGAHTTAGYSETWDGRRVLLAHRVAHEMWVGPIPPGYEIDHLCRNRGCVNPAHLEAVTPRVNNLRGDTPASRNARRTHCVNGHEFTPENLYSTASGRRVCKTCDSLRQKARAKGRTVKTECPQGHPYDTENTYVYLTPTGRRERACRECARTRARAQYWAKRADQ